MTIFSSFLFLPISVCGIHTHPIINDSICNMLSLLLHHYVSTTFTSPYGRSQCISLHSSSKGGVACLSSSSSDSSSSLPTLFILSKWSSVPSMKYLLNCSIFVRRPSFRWRILLLFEKSSQFSEMFCALLSDIVDHFIRLVYHITSWMCTLFFT